MKTSTKHLIGALRNLRIEKKLGRNNQKNPSVAKERKYTALSHRQFNSKSYRKQLVQAYK